MFKQLTAVAKNVFLRTSNPFNDVTGFPSQPPPQSPRRGYDFNFVEVPRNDNLVQISTDVVIIGSGCAAGVASRNIAAAGHRVLVVDKGYHVPTSSLPLPQDEAYFQLFEQGGMIAAEDGSVSVTAGSCFGGGGTVNWSASLQPQSVVRSQWSGERGLTFFNTAEF